MREIKFRAWDTGKKIMREVIRMNFRTKQVLYRGYNIPRILDFPLMQYTGTKDDEGNEIYEGDIVKAYKYGDKEKDPFIGNVEFRSGVFCYSSWNWHEFLNKFRYAEVIGNIYESEDYQC